jgi:hypothetical protein
MHYHTFLSVSALTAANVVHRMALVLFSPLGMLFIPSFTKIVQFPSVILLLITEAETSHACAGFPKEKQTSFEPR